MALITKNLVTSPDVIVDFTYDDVALLLTNVTVNNTSARDITVSLTSTSTGKNYTYVLSPGVYSQDTPPGTTNRLDITITPSGKIDGVEWMVY